MNASLVTRGGGVNTQIGYVVLDANEADTAVLGDLGRLRERAKSLFSTLSSSDVVLDPSVAFRQTIDLINGQRVQFFEVLDGSLSVLSSLSDPRFRLLSPVDLNAQGALLQTRSGSRVQLGIASCDAGLGQMIAKDQGLAPVLDFSGFAAGQAIRGQLCVSREADYDSVTGFYRTINAEGWVRNAAGQIVKPGDQGYEAAALAAANVVGSLQSIAVADNQFRTQAFSLTGESTYLAPFARVNGDTYFAYAQANGDGFNHFISLGENTFGFEDMPFGGDRDFDDQVIAFCFDPLA